MTTISPDHSRGPLIAAGIFGLTGVAIGALGAHEMAAELAERGTMRAWETAARYQLFHAVALLAAAIWIRVCAGEGNAAAVNRMRWAARWWSFGIPLFSASLYWLALGGPRWLGPVTPFGGIALMAGWFYVIAAAVAKPKPPQ
ncbi:MAG: hypothetical protein RIQ93_1993 [Verrucomicrobiota bacterium]|jgi:uncharacterized membrane protein YgdD (TMEM256/DUF423 family)